MFYGYYYSLITITLVGSIFNLLVETIRPRYLVSYI
jgi:hypothetical protein